MIVRTRLKSILIAAFAYLAAAGGIGYFAFHAYNGDRGLIAKEAYKAQMATLSQELADVRRDKAQWSHRVALLRSGNLDPDLLDERAREMLNASHPNDVKLVLP
jgi:cell division protein FtsB